MLLALAVFVGQPLAANAEDAQDAAAAAPAAEPVNIEHRLENQRTTNDALRARIAALEALLAGDVCDDLDKAQALLDAPAIPSADKSGG